MQISQSKKVLSDLETMFALNQKIKELTEQATLLKDHYKESFPSGVTCGDFTFVNKPMSRTNLDKKALEKELGDLTPFQTITEYFRCEVIKG